MGNASRKDFRTLLDHVSDMVTLSDRDGRIVYANAATEQVSGYPPEEFVKLNPFDLMHPEDRPRCEGVLERLRFEPGLTLIIEHRIRHADGEWRWVECRFESLFEEPSIEGLVATVRDITERKTTEENLRDSEARLHVALGAAELGTFVWHVTEDRTEADARALAHFGLPPDAEATLMDSLANIFHPEDGPRYVAAIERATDPVGSGRLHEEFRITRPDGERWMSVTAMTVFEGSPPAPTRITGVLEDITERKRTENMLRESEERQIFLLKLADALGPLSDAVSVQEAATQTAMEHFDCDRCYYCEIEDGDAIIHRDSLRGEEPSVAGTYSLEDFAIFKALVETGHPLIVEDVRTTDSVDEELRELCVGLGVISFIGIHVVKDGSLAGALYLTQRKPRRWAYPEARLAREVVERIWQAVERAKTEEALRESEAKYRALFDSIDEGYALCEVMYDGEGRVIDLLLLETNPAHGRITGLEVAAGKTVREVNPEIEESWIEAASHVLETGEPVRIENYVAGVSRWLDIHLSRVGEAAQRTIGMIFRDVTERKQQEQRQEFLLRLSDTLRAETGVEAVGNRAVRMIAEQLGADRVYLVILTPGDDNVVVTHETRREDLPPMLGSYRSSDFPSAIAEIFERTIVYEDVRTDPRLTDLDRLSFAGLGAVGFIAAPIRRGSEARIWAAGALSTQPRAWTATEIALFEDAIERTWAAVERARAEEALRKAEEEYRTFVSATSDVVYKMSADWREMRSLAGKEFIATTDEARTGWTQGYIPETDEHLVWETIQKAIETRSPFELEHRVNRLDGSIGWTYSRAIPVLDEEGEIVEWLGAAKDITERKRAEEALRDSEERLRLAADAGEIGLWELDLHTNKSPVRSPRHDAIFGYEEPLERWNIETFLAHVHPEDRERIRLSFERAFETGRWAFESRILRADGAERWISARGRFAFDKAGEPIRATGTVQDITENRRAEEELRASEASLRMAQETARLGYWTHDLVSGEFVASEICRAHFGWKTGDVLTYEDLAEAIHPDDRDDMHERMRRALEERSEYRAEYRVTWPDGSVRWISARGTAVYDGSGEPVSISSVTMDVTESREAERVSSYLATLVESTTDAVIGFREDFGVVSWNRGARVILGRDAEQAIGSSLLDLFPEEDRTAFESHFPMSWGNELHDHVIRMLRADDSYVYVSLSVSPVLNGGESPGYVLVMQDITERRLAERTLGESEERFRTLVEQSPIAIHIIAPDGTSLRANPAWMQLWKLSDDDETAGGNVFDGPMLRSANLIPCIEKAIAGERHATDSIPYDPLDSGASSERMWLRAFSYPVFGEGSEVREVVLMIQDVTEGELRRHEQERSEIREAAIRAEIAERKRISRDLHDRVAHSMGVAHQSLELYSTLSETNPKRAEERLELAREHTLAALGQTRDLAKELRRSVADEMFEGLEKAVRKLLETTVPADTPTDFAFLGDEGILTREVGAQVYLIVREALSNVVRHSNCENVHLEIEIDQSGVSALVSDDGDGFDEEGEPKDVAQAGIGLGSMRERTRMLGGELTLKTKPGDGTEITLHIPLT